jgi:hypothetical protein
MEKEPMENISGLGSQIMDEIIGANNEFGETTLQK